MTTAKKGDLVFVHYTGSFDTGEVFDSSKDSSPLNFVLGEGQIIPGFEKAIIGMAVNEKKSVLLDPKDAYGPFSEEKIITTERENFGEGFEPEKDLQIALQLEDGNRAIATIKDFDEKSVTLDLNHPLAGKNLNFDLELIDIKDASEAPTCGSGGCSSCSGCGHD
jgi:FKBP-type peptidyl-prolyl cis-trans isomerase 2